MQWQGRRQSANVVDGREWLNVPFGRPSVLAPADWDRLRQEMPPNPYAMQQQRAMASQGLRAATPLSSAPLDPITANNNWARFNVPGNTARASHFARGHAESYAPQRSLTPPGAMFGSPSGFAEAPSAGWGGLFGGLFGGAPAHDPWGGAFNPSVSNDPGSGNAAQSGKSGKK